MFNNKLFRDFCLEGIIVLKTDKASFSIEFGSYLQWTCSLISLEISWSFVPEHLFKKNLCLNNKWYNTRCEYQRRKRDSHFPWSWLCLQTSTITILLMVPREISVLCRHDLRLPAIFGSGKHRIPFIHKYKSPLHFPLCLISDRQQIIF